MVCSKLKVWGKNVQMVKGCLPSIHPPLPLPNQAQIIKDPLLLCSLFRESGSNSNLDSSHSPHHSSWVSRPPGLGQSGDNLECQVETLLSLSPGHGRESTWFWGLLADLKCSGHHRRLNRETDRESLNPTHLKPDQMLGKPSWSACTD